MRTARNKAAARHRDTPSWREVVLLDDLVERYVDWRESSWTVAEAYARWSFAPSPERVARFAAYNAMLDQEQKTAAAYADAVADLERYVRGSRA